MRSKSEILRNPRLEKLPDVMGFEACRVRTRTGIVTVLFGFDEDGWEHVSVSPIGSKYECDQQCPTWSQMCEVKNIFWKPKESVMQFHPAEEHYLHGLYADTNILHLWRPRDGDWSILNKGMTA